MLMLLCASDTGVGEAALYALVGFVIVLSVLALLVGIFYLTGRIFQTKALGKENLFERKPKNKKYEEQPAQPDEQSSDEELFAVISAAIAAVYDSEQGEEKPEFVIRRVTRKK